MPRPVDVPDPQRACARVRRYMKAFDQHEGAVEAMRLARSLIDYRDAMGWSDRGEWVVVLPADLPDRLYYIGHTPEGFPQYHVDLEQALVYPSALAAAFASDTISGEPLRLETTVL